MTTFFTSDTHFNHVNQKGTGVIDYCNRPFQNIEEMNEAIIRRWNMVVGYNDIVYHLGDFSFGPKEMAAEILGRLVGRKILIKGNHDRSLAVMKEMGFDEAHSELTTEIDGIIVHMTHKPIERMNTTPPGGLLYQVPPPTEYALCGHVHTEWRRRGRVINVGVDQWDFTPVPLATLIKEA